MKIIYLHQYFMTPDMSGGTRSYEMARRMVAAGHDVHMVTSRADETATAGWMITDEAGIKVHWLPVAYDNSMSIPQRLKAFAEFALRAGSYAGKLGGDVVFATSTPLTIAIPAVRASRRLKAPMVFEVRDLWPEAPIAMGALKNPLARALARRLETWAYRNAEQVVALSSDMVDGVVSTGYPRERTHCIPNSSDTALFDIDREVGERFRAERPWLGERPLLVYAGTFGRVNGLSYMVDLAQQMLCINPEFRFLAVGKGAEEDLIRAKAAAAGVLERNFFIEPPVKKKDLPAVLSAATVASSFVIPVPELWKNSANKFFDALAAKRPMVVNHGGWQADILDETGAGIDLDPFDHAAAAVKLNSFVADSDAMDRARKAASDLAYGRFSRDKLAQDLIRVLESVVADRI